MEPLESVILVSNIEDMQIVGKIIAILPEVTGSGKNGEWKKKDIVIETESQYSKRVCIAFWGDKGGSSALQLNNSVQIDFELDSREYNGKWFTEVKGWRVELKGQGVEHAVSKGLQSAQAPLASIPAPSSSMDAIDDSVPF